ncbi:carboxyltransferase domain-containing protein [Candidatus Pelagibacter sp.]|nr:carboxyltransferase domain-containing protein [Candidatus Pelagibacter sp.]
MIKNILNLGDAALYCDFGNEVNQEVNSNVIKYFYNIKELNIEGITNLTPSYNKLIISYDLNFHSFLSLKEKIEKIEIKKNTILEKNIIEIPVCCENKFALDIERIENKLKLNAEIILEKFFSKNYFCYMTGFVAGMPFLGDLNQEMRLKRLETPRVKVPKGSVGITEQFCNIYSFETPGGWNILGNTPQNIFDTSNQSRPNLINPGDTIKFYRVTLNEYNEIKKKKSF